MPLSQVHHAPGKQLSIKQRHRFTAITNKLNPNTDHVTASFTTLVRVIKIRFQKKIGVSGATSRTVNQFILWQDYNHANLITSCKSTLPYFRNKISGNMHLKKRSIDRYVKDHQLWDDHTYNLRGCRQHHLPTPAPLARISPHPSPIHHLLAYHKPTKEPCSKIQHFRQLFVATSRHIRPFASSPGRWRPPSPIRLLSTVNQFPQRAIRIQILNPTHCEPPSKSFLPRKKKKKM